MNGTSSFAERVANLHIPHPRVKKIWETLDSIRRHNSFQGGNNSPRHRFIVGLSGVGKTQMMKRYADQNAGYVQVEDEGTEYDIRPVVYVNLPDPFTIMELYRSIIHGLGAPQLSGRPTIGEVKRQVFTLLAAQRVEMLILDEMDHILTTRFVTTEEAMGAIKHITNHGKVSVICVGTPAVEELRKIDSQYFRRYPPTRLDRFRKCDHEFYDLLASIEEQLQPPEPLGFIKLKISLQEIVEGVNTNKVFTDDEKKVLEDAKFLAGLLHRSTYGLVGYLTPVIQEAYSLLGIFESDFEETTTELNLKKVLREAYQNIIGDVSEEELKKMIDDKGGNLIK
jgi:Cdc6-like AAA superfamily ATPase